MTFSKASLACRLRSRSRARSVSSLRSCWACDAIHGGVSNVACLCGLRASCRGDISISGSNS